MSSHQSKKVCRLSADSINRICSSQAVANLSGALKELIENSIDAGATLIDIKAVEWGIDALICLDNGSGISAENHQKIGLRSHTSKISSFEDLEKADTFGFRGEALSSLASLGNLEIVTCTDPPLGYKLSFNHMGELVKTSRTARSKGTTVQVDNLFCTIPVRRQEFIKHAKKQFSKCVELLHSFCLAYPNVRFILANSLKGTKTTLLQSNGSKDLKNVISNLFGASTVVNLVRFDGQSTVDDVGGEWTCSFSSLFSKPKPTCGRGDTDRQFLFVNNHPMEIPKLSKALNQLYHDYNPSQFPFIVLFLSIPKEKYDRNVTPDKRRLILEDEDQMLNQIRQSLRDLFEPYRGEFAVPALSGKSKQILLKPTAQSQSTASRSSSDETQEYQAAQPFRQSMMKDGAERLCVNLEKMAKSRKRKTMFAVNEGNFETPLFIHKSDFESMNVIGQFNLGFILVGFQDHLFIVDQHASEEKYLFEKFRDETNIIVQSLLSPKQLFLTPQQQSLIYQHKETLKERGFVVKQINDEWFLSGVPQMKNYCFGKADFEETLELLSESSTLLPICKKMQAIFASKACRSAVMIGDPLSHKHMTKIVHNMANLIQPWACPHGRPTLRLLAKLTKLTIQRDQN